MNDRDNPNVPRETIAQAPRKRGRPRKNPEQAQLSKKPYTDRTLKTMEKKLGRPQAPILTEPQIAIVEENLRDGTSPTTAVWLAGGSLQQLENTCRERPDFFERIKKAQAERYKQVETMLLYPKKDFNVVGLIFWLKNRLPTEWKERVEVTTDNPYILQVVSGSGTQTVRR